MEASREWLEQFPEQVRGAICGWFYNAVRDAAAGIALEELSLSLLCSDVYRHLSRAVKEEGSHVSGGVNKLAVLRRMQADPEGARRLMAWVIAQEGRTPEQKARDKQAKQEEGKRAYMERLAPTQKQLDMLLKLGVDEFPDNRWRASELIEEHKTW